MLLRALPPRPRAKKRECSATISCDGLCAGRPALIMPYYWQDSAASYGDAADIHVDLRAAAYEAQDYARLHSGDATHYDAAGCYTADAGYVAEVGADNVDAIADGVAYDIAVDQVNEIWRRERRRHRV